MPPLVTLSAGWLSLWFLAVAYLLAFRAAVPHLSFGFQGSSSARVFARFTVMLGHLDVPF